MAARLIFLGKLADLAGCAESSLACAAPLGWAEVLVNLEEHLGVAAAEALRGPQVKVALNGTLVADRAALVLCDGDELAFLPPVSGG